MHPADTTYLGDGVYAKDDGDGFLLTTPEDAVNNLIFLDEYVYAALVRFVEKRQPNFNRGAGFTTTQEELNHL